MVFIVVRYEGNSMTEVYPSDEKYADQLLKMTSFLVEENQHDSPLERWDVHIVEADKLASHIMAGYGNG